MRFARLKGFVKVVHCFVGEDDVLGVLILVELLVDGANSVVGVNGDDGVVVGFGARRRRVFVMWLNVQPVYERVKWFCKFSNLFSIFAGRQCFWWTDFSIFPIRFARRPPGGLAGGAGTWGFAGGG